MKTGVYVRPGQRVGCDLRPLSSALKKSGQLIQIYCWKCESYCWLYRGQKYRYISVIRHKK